MSTNNNTRKIVTLLTVLIVGAMMSGCVTPETPISTPDVYMSEIGEQCSNGLITICVYEYITIDKYEYIDFGDYVEIIYPKKNHHFIIFNCIIQNVGKESQCAGHMDFSMEDQNKRRYDVCDKFWMTDIIEMKPHETLFTGQITDGLVIFEIPIDSTECIIYYNAAPFHNEPKLAGWHVSL